MVIKKLYRKPKKQQIIYLDPSKISSQARDFTTGLNKNVIGQKRATKQVSQLYQKYLAGMAIPNKPIGTMLFLGPTGVGKTKIVEASAKELLGYENAIMKINCAEFQHSHEIAKLTGSPPGYLGHRETSPMLTQENLDSHHTEDNKITFLLFDEIEKAKDSLWQLLLGILDKATLTLGDNRTVDFSKTIVILTSNLGTRSVTNLLSAPIGFAPGTMAEEDAKVDQKIYKVALKAAKRNFSPEFMNRIDKVVVFRSLKNRHLREILDLELSEVQDRITNSSGTKFIFTCSENAKQFLFKEGYSKRYGARELKRSIERFLVYPLSNIVATEQVQTGDIVAVDYSEKQKKLIFEKLPETMIVAASS